MVADIGGARACACKEALRSVASAQNASVSSSAALPVLIVSAPDAFAARPGHRLPVAGATTSTHKVSSETRVFPVLRRPLRAVQCDLAALRARACLGRL